MSQSNSEIQFLNTLIKESHIVFNRLGDYKVELNFTPRGVVFKSLNQFVLYLQVTIRDVENGFHINISTESIFSYPENADLEQYKKSLFVSNAPAIVFPYIRAYISSLTALSGMPVLTLPTLILTNLGNQLKDNISEED